MDDLEEMLKSLTKERVALIKANEALKQRNQQLATENDTLKSQMATTTDVKPIIAGDGGVSPTAFTFKPAALINERQQHAQVNARVGSPLNATLVVALLLQLFQQVARSPTASPKSSCCSISSASTQQQAEAIVRLPAVFGPHNRTWNPAYNWLAAH